MHQPTFGVWRVELTDLIAGFGVVSQRLIAMREALRHVERPPIVLAEFDRDMLEVGRALGSQVDDDVEDRAPRASHELGLGRRRILEVHASKCALLQVEREVGLGDDRL